MFLSEIKLNPEWIDFSEYRNTRVASLCCTAIPILCIARRYSVEKLFAIEVLFLHFSLLNAEYGWVESLENCIKMPLFNLCTNSIDIPTKDVTVSVFEIFESSSRTIDSFHNFNALL